MPRATLRPRGQLTLPTEVREALKLNDGDDIDFQFVGEGVVLMHGLKMIPADQAWFWTESWQAGEHEAEDDIRSGRTTIHKTVDDMFGHLGA